MQRCSNYLRVLIVKVNEKGTERLMFMLSQFKSKTEIYSKYDKLSSDNLFIKHNWKCPGLHKYSTKQEILNIVIIK